MGHSFSNKVIESNFKGFPIDSYGKTLEAFLATKPNLFTSNFQFPIMVLKEKSLKNNIDQMASFCKSVGAELAPHVKTTMSPQIAQMQTDAGATALTIANFWQASIFISFGFKRLIKIVKQHTPDGGEQNLFIEIGTDDGRGGVRDLDEVATIAKAIAADSRLKLRGVTGFEGAVPDAARSKKGEKKISKFCQKIVAAADRAYPYKSDAVFIISAGGSAYFEIVADELNKFAKEKILLLRSGGYVTHDSKYYEEIYPFRDSRQTFKAAIEVWAQIISSPEPNFGVLNLGKRDIGNDLHNPIPFAKYASGLTTFSGQIEKLNDQHGYLRSKQDFAVSQLIGLGISHPCTTFDKWRLIPLVNDNYDVVDCLYTFF